MIMMGASSAHPAKKLKKDSCVYPDGVTFLLALFGAGVQARLIKKLKKDRFVYPDGAPLLARVAPLILETVMLFVSSDLSDFGFDTEFEFHCNGESVDT